LIFHLQEQILKKSKGKIDFVGDCEDIVGITVAALGGSSSENDDCDTDQQLLLSPKGQKFPTPDCVHPSGFSITSFRL
jgi:hypothetical protein